MFLHTPEVKLINKVSTDDFAGWLALQTNLALKGIVGINAMSKLSILTGNDDDASYFKVYISLQHVRESRTNH